MKNTAPSLLSHFRGVVRGALGWLLLLACLSGSDTRAASSPPDRMTYQGFLVNDNGSPLAPTTPINYPVIFRIFSEAEGGELKWSEQQIVTVDKGNFSVVLGEGTEVSGEPHGPLSQVFMDNTASDRFIGITVTVNNNPMVLLPRLRLLPAPYAFLASQAVQLVNPSSGTPFMSLNGSEATIPGNARFGNEVFWSTGAYLRNDQGGSIELGNSLSTGLMPYIDFSFGSGSAQDYNVRLINDANQRLSLLGGRLSFGSGLANTKIALYESGINSYGLGIQGSQFRLHLDTTTARFSFLASPAATAELMTIRGTGNVGINSANPGHKLEVKGGAEVAWFESSGENAYIRVSDNTGFNNRVEFASRGNGRAAIWSNGDHLNVLQNGRVGIGTTTPTHPLNIRTPDMAQARIRIEQGANISEFGRVEQYAFVLLNNSLHTAANRWAAYDGDSNWDFHSDRKLKKDIEDAEPMLERALQVQVRRYRWKEDKAEAKHKLGVIAQEVQALFPDLVTEMQDVNNSKETLLTVGYGDFGVIAIKAIQELNAKVESRDARIEALEREVTALKKQVAANVESHSQTEARLAAIEKLLQGASAAGEQTKLASSPAR
jgi:hypothetical protein